MTRPKQLAASVVAWWCGVAARSRDAYLLAGFIGLTVFLLVFGLGHLTGSSHYWDLPEVDARPHLMGYRYLLDEPWHWPVFESHKINVPFTKNIFLTDSIPLFALVNKAIATVFPPWGRLSTRSYLGMWHAIVYALQCVLAVANMRELGRRKISDAFWTSIVFLSFPTFIFRYGHASLSAHFLLLAALLLYLRSGKSPEEDRKVWLHFLALLVVGALVNPYHMAMGLALYAAALTRGRRWLSAAIWLPLGLASAGLTVWLAGFLSKESRVHMPGFEIASTNMLSPFVPARSILFGDGHGIANVVAVPYQYEGYVYFGLGLLVLSLLFVVFHVRRWREVRDVVRRHPVLFLLVVGTWIYSLSNHVYFGSHRILEFTYPPAFQGITRMFRVPGRFVWLPAYVLVAYLFAWALGRFEGRTFRFVVPALAIVQVVDGGLGDWKIWRDQTREPWADLIGMTAWRPLMRAHSAIEQVPPYDCLLDGSVPSLDYVAQQVQYLASETMIPINGVYSARPTRDCAAEQRKLESAAAVPGTLYVVFPHGAAAVRPLVSSGATCSDFAWGRVCSTDAVAIDAARKAGAVHDSPLLAVGSPIEFASKAQPFLRHGWIQDTDGVWTEGPTSGLSFRLEQGVQELVFRASPSHCSARTKSSVDVSLNGAPATTVEFDEPSEVVRRVSLPSTVQGGSVTVQMRPHDVRSTMAMGCGSDAHQRAIKIHAIWVE